MKKNINAAKPENKNELKQTIENVWDQQISDEIIKKLVDSVSTRIASAIKAKDGPAKKVFKNIFLINERTYLLC